MRFDTPIFFQFIKHGEYDSDTGNYGVDETIETKRWANVTNAGVETLNLIYGELRQNSYVVRLQTRYEKTFERIRIGNKLYRVDFQRELKTKQVFVISEVQ